MAGIGGVGSSSTSAIEYVRQAQLAGNRQQEQQVQQLAQERNAEQQRIEAAKAAGSSLGTNVNTFAWEIFSLEKSFFRKRLFSFYLIL